MTYYHGSWRGIDMSTVMLSRLKAQMSDLTGIPCVPVCLCACVPVYLSLSLDYSSLTF
jgi:hypothetical protein